MNERLQSLYNTLKGDGYELPSFDVFTQDMADSTKANRMYNTLVTDGYELPTSFDVFYKDISPAQPQQTQPENTPSPDRPLGFSRLADPETYKEIGQGISDVVGTINKGATRFIPDILKTVGAVEETVGGKGYFTKAGEAVQEGIDYLNPVDPEFEQSFGGQVLSGAGQIIPLIATAGMSGGANALEQARLVGGFL